MLLWEDNTCYRLLGSEEGAMQGSIERGRQLEISEKSKVYKEHRASQKVTMAKVRE